MATRHIYHYHATYQIEPGSIGHIDGIAIMTKRVEDMVDYQDLKASIVPLLSKEVSADKLIIESLSYHGAEKE